MVDVDVRRALVLFLLYLESNDCPVSVSEVVRTGVDFLRSRSLSLVRRLLSWFLACELIREAQSTCHFSELCNCVLGRCLRVAFCILLV